MGVALEQEVSKSWKDLEQHDRKSLHRQVSRNLDFDDTASEGSKEVRKLLLETGGRGSLLGSDRKLSNIIICSNTKSICPWWTWPSI